MPLCNNLQECSEHCLEWEPELELILLKGICMLICMLYVSSLRISFPCVFQWIGVPLYHPWFMPQQTAPLLSRVLPCHTLVIKATAVTTHTLSSAVQLTWSGQRLMGFGKGTVNHFASFIINGTSHGLVLTLWQMADVERVGERAMRMIDNPFN